MRNDYLHSAVYYLMALADERAKASHDAVGMTVEPERAKRLRLLFGRAIWHLHEDTGNTTEEIAARLTASLRNQGWTEDQIAQAGVNGQAIRRIEIGRASCRERVKISVVAV